TRGGNPKLCDGFGSSTAFYVQPSILFLIQ
ncbi:hypothetical protein A2U01_0097490, partial [Trifolium medium]|nr:hypothetical protein [Trifolium medium]